MTFYKFILILVLIYIFRPKNIIGWIEDINKLPLWFKSIVISVFCIIPFWFIILYLYFPNLLNFEWYTILAFCFVPSIVWYMLYILQGLLISYLFNDLKTDINNSVFWIGIIFDTVIYLIFLSVLLIILHINFYCFIGLLFGYKILTLILTKPYMKFLSKI